MYAKKIALGLCAMLVGAKSYAMEDATQQRMYVFPEAVNVQAGGIPVSEAVINAEFHGTQVTRHETNNVYVDPSQTPRSQQLPFRDRLVNTIEQNYIQLLAALAVQGSIELTKMACMYALKKLAPEDEPAGLPQSQDDALVMELVRLKNQAMLFDEIERQLESNESYASAQPDQDLAKAEQEKEKRAQIRKSLIAMRAAHLEKLNEVSGRMQENVAEEMAAAAA